MKKSLLALAVVAALPAVASAQVTLSGFVKTGVMNTKTGTNSGTGIADGASQFILSSKEDLGGGLSAFYQLSNFAAVNSANTAGPVAVNGIAVGESFVGLGGSFGKVGFGRYDLHYFWGSDEHAGLATALQHWSVSLLGSIWANGAHVIAANGRTDNVVKYDLPTMGGFNGGAAYSFSTASALDNSSGTKPGTAYNVYGMYAAGPAVVGASYWDAKDNATGAGDNKSTRIWGTYDLGAVKLGLTFDSSSAGETGAAGGQTKRDAWSIPLVAPVGNGLALLTYTKADDVKVNGASTANTGASMVSLGYHYNLSKRTSLGVSYAKVENKAASNYWQFVNTVLSTGANPALGANTSGLYAGVKHAF